MRIAAIDTTGPVIGVALLAEGRVLARSERVRKGAEALLIPWLQALCQQAEVPLASLDGVAVSHGPGAFTGLRVGLATAAGLAQGLGVPLWSTSSLDSRARRVRGEGQVLALIDARKGKAYAALYAADGALLRGPADLPPVEAIGWASAPFVATGEGAALWRELVEGAGGVVADDAADPAVDALALMGEVAIAAGLGREPHAVTPVYLREPDAKPPAAASV
ncbi:MAG: tRNA (adenosine(37)-N6)-threonylcarbamoyltransferase complex dimerization subunit type 1 TsaB [Deltaproteobacteria bacterium]|nr:tRNA (adenosine(37)-N6)-threonylcarbamoyltransferase complex dimerization subunit type 1 TsaB [Deltaproteobacteria bacterium]